MISQCHHQHSHHHLNLVTLTFLLTSLPISLSTSQLISLLISLLTSLLPLLQTHQLHADLISDVKVVGGLQDLESDFSSMMMDTRKDLADCNIGDIQFYLDDLFGIDEFRKCQTIDEVLRKLRHDRIDTFNIRYLERLIREFH